MKYKENDIIRIGETSWNDGYAKDNSLYEVMDILTIKNIPGFDSDIFYNLRNLITDDRILLESKSIDQEHLSFLDTQYMREQRLNRILNDK